MICCLLFYGILIACMQRKCAFRGRKRARRVIQTLEVDNIKASRDVNKERHAAIRASTTNANRLTISLDDKSVMQSEHAIVVKDLQCWKSLSKRDIGAKNQHSVIIRQGWCRQGVYSVKGVSFCVGHGEKFVILGSASSGRTSLLQNIAGLERILTGEVLVNGMSTKELYKDLKNVHGLIGYQP